MLGSLLPAPKQSFQRARPVQPSVDPPAFDNGRMACTFAFNLQTRHALRFDGLRRGWLADLSAGVELIALTGTSDAQLSHPRLQSRALHAESSGGTRGTADHPIGFAESAHDVLPLGMLQSEDAVERRNRDYFRSLL